jgi:hypothetical protein
VLRDSKNCPCSLAILLPVLAAHRWEVSSAAKQNTLGSKSPIASEAASLLLDSFYSSRPTVEPDIFIFYEKTLVEVNQAIIAWSF